MARDILEAIREDVDIFQEVQQGSPAESWGFLTMIAIGSIDGYIVHKCL